jgi:hypothetical protein
MYPSETGIGVSACCVQLFRFYTAHAARLTMTRLGEVILALSRIAARIFIARRNA